MSFEEDRRRELEFARAFLLRERSRIRTWSRSQDILQAFLGEFHGRGQAASQARVSEILEVTESLNFGNANSTKLLFLGVVRTWYRYLYELGKLLHPVHTRLTIKRKPRSLPASFLSYEEIEEWFSLCCPEDFNGVLDRALLEVVYGSGLRAGEVYGLKLHDLDLGEQTVLIRRSKNDEGRTLPLTGQATTALHTYLRRRPLLSSFLWLDQTAGRITPNRLKSRIRRIYQPKLSFPKKVSLRILRHSFATHLLQNGADIRAIQALLGHRDIRSTAVYTRVCQEDLRQALTRARELLNLPTRVRRGT